MRRKILQELRDDWLRSEEITQIEEDESEQSEDKEGEERKTITVRCNLSIRGKNIEVIVDSGAATNIITNKLRKKLGIKIEEPSKTIFTMANGKKTASLGKTRIEIEVEDKIK